MGAGWKLKTTICLAGILVAIGSTTTVRGQGFPQGHPAPSTPPPTGIAPPGQAPPRQQAPPGRAPPGQASVAQSPRYVQVVENAAPAPSQGQVWREYDLRPYLTRVRGMENPQGPVIEWILRETSTDQWLGDVPGMLSFEGDKLRIYHLPEVHEVVANVVDRFVNPELSKFSVSVRLITVENTGWREMALPLMDAISVETPGLQAWTVSRENAARLGAQLRSRVEFQVHNSADVQIGHGQTHTVERWQPRSYPERLQQTPNHHPGYQVLSGQINEGYSLTLSPLALTGGESMDVVVKCNVAQIEKMTPVSLNMPNGNSSLSRVQIEVPQVNSWRVYERFRWKTDQVLVISRGMVAMPGVRGGSTNPFAAVVGSSPARADALLILDCREAAASVSSAGGDGDRVGRVNYHGRY